MNNGDEKVDRFVKFRAVQLACSHQQVLKPCPRACLHLLATTHTNLKPWRKTYVSGTEKAMPSSTYSSRLASHQYVMLTGMHYVTNMSCSLANNMWCW